MQILSFFLSPFSSFPTVSPFSAAGWLVVVAAEAMGRRGGTKMGLNLIHSFRLLLSSSAVSLKPKGGGGGEEEDSGSNKSIHLAAEGRGQKRGKGSKKSLLVEGEK